MHDAAGARGYQMPLPLILLDFEASSLGRRSYPIEVGVALAIGESGPILYWSTLIKPASAWTRSGDWDPAAERVHGIAPHELGTGMSVQDTAQALNRACGPIGHAFCDGGEYDAMWLERLFAAAGCSPEFQLHDLTSLFVTDRTLHRRFVDILAGTAPPHRAGDDAARLCLAMVRAGGGDVSDVTAGTPAMIAQRSETAVLSGGCNQ